MDAPFECLSRSKAPQRMARTLRRIQLQSSERLQLQLGRLVLQQFHEQLLGAQSIEKGTMVRGASTVRFSEHEAHLHMKLHKEWKQRLIALVQAAGDVGDLA